MLVQIIILVIVTVDHEPIPGTQGSDTYRMGCQSHPIIKLKSHQRTPYGLACTQSHTLS